MSSSSSSANPLFQPADTQPILVHGVIPPQVQDVALPVELGVLPVGSGYQRCSEWQHTYLLYQPLLQNLPMMYSVPSHGSLAKKLNSFGHGTNAWVYH